jgi:hypothetical protein
MFLLLLLQQMKRKIAIFNLVLMALVQFTIAFKSFHAFRTTMTIHTKQSTL